jgi:hypothetical protein
MKFEEKYNEYNLKIVISKSRIISIFKDHELVAQKKLRTKNFMNEAKSYLQCELAYWS